MKPTPSELELLETREHRTKLWLSIYQPETMLACQVNDASIEKGAIDITYDNVTDGSHDNVKADMTMYVGTSLGGAEKGKIRVRSADASTITVAENAHINWEDNDYLTIVDFYEITAKYPRHIQNPNEDLDLIFYKDYDIAYTNQNDLNGHFINMGCHYAGFVDPATDKHSVYYTASGTSHVNNDVTGSSYHWWFRGGDPTGSHVHTPGYVDYDTPGHYTTELIVSGSNDSVDSSYRHVSIYDRPEEGNNNPILKWEMEPISGGRVEGGYSTRIRLREDASKDIIRDGALVVIFAEDWYGDTKQSIRGNALNRDNIVFVGYILDGTIEYDWRSSSWIFEAGSPTMTMNRSESYSEEVQDKNNPSNQFNTPVELPEWTIMESLTPEKGIWYYLKWHSTALKVMDIEFDADNYPIQFFTSDRNSLYDAVNTAMDSTVLGEAVSDLQGKLWLESGYKYKDNVEDEYPSLFVLNRDKWRGQPTFEETINDPVSFLQMGGVAYSGTTGTFKPFLSGAPGTSPTHQIVPAYRGTSRNRQGLALLSQSELNKWSGNYYAHLNSDYQNINYDLAGNYSIVDVAPQQIIDINMDEEDTVRRITFDEKPFIINEQTLEYDPENEILTQTVGLYEVTQGFPGDTIPIPDFPDFGGFGFPGWSWPSFNVPPWPNFGSPYFAETTVRNHHSQSLSITDFPYYTSQKDSGVNSAAYISSSPKRSLELEKVEDESGNILIASGSDRFFYVSGDRAGGEDFTGADGKVRVSNYDGVVYGAIDQDTDFYAESINYISKTKALVLEHKVAGTPDTHKLTLFDFGNNSKEDLYTISLDANESITDSFGTLLSIGDKLYHVFAYTSVDSDFADGQYTASKFRIYNITDDNDLGTLTSNRFGCNTSSVDKSFPRIVEDNLIFIISIRDDSGGSCEYSEIRIYKVDVLSQNLAETIHSIGSSSDIHAIGPIAIADYSEKSVVYEWSNVFTNVANLYDYYPETNQVVFRKSLVWNDVELLQSQSSTYYLDKTDEKVYSLRSDEEVDVSSHPNISSIRYSDGLCPTIDDIEKRVWIFNSSDNKLYGYSMLGDPIKTIDVPDVGSSSDIFVRLHGGRIFFSFSDDNSYVIY